MPDRFYKIAIKSFFNRMFSETCRKKADYKISHSPPLALLQVPKTEFEASWPRKELNPHGNLLLPPQGLCCLPWSCSTASPAKKWVGLDRKVFSKKSPNDVILTYLFVIWRLNCESFCIIVFIFFFFPNGFDKSRLEWSRIYIKSYFSLKTYHLYSSVDFFH